MQTDILIYYIHLPRRSRPVKTIRSIFLLVVVVVVAMLLASFQTPRSDPQAPPAADAAATYLGFPQASLWRLFFDIKITNTNIYYLHAFM